MSMRTNTEVRESLRDPDYRGNDYSIDTMIKSGPMAKRRCTDVLCLLIFLAACGGIGYIGNYAYTNGDPSLILAPMDAAGNLCGKSPGYEGHKLLWYQNLSTISWLPYGVCVSSCPDETTTVVDCIPTAQTDPQPTNANQCTPMPAPYATVNFLNRYCIPNLGSLVDSAAQTPLYNNMIGTVGLDDLNQWVDDIIQCPNVYYIAIGSSLVLIWLWNLMLRSFAEVLAWLSIIIVGVGLFVSGFLVRDYAIENYPEGTSTQKWLNISAYVIWGLLGIYLIAILCCWYSLKIAIKVLRTAARVIMNNMKMVVVPIFQIVVTVAWIGASVYALFWLLSCGEIMTNTVPGTSLTYRTYSYTDEQKYFIYAAIFFFFWVTAFLIAVADYVLIVAVCSWYFTENTDKRGNFSIFKGYWWAIRYNLGSLLFGSFIIAVVWTIRIIFEYIERKIKNNNGQMAPALQWVLKGMRCCLDCCHRFIKYVNKNAYCQVALTGENFCTAAINGFLLILKHSMTFAFTSGLGGIFNMLGKLSVAIVNVIVGFFILQYYPELHG